MGKKRDSRFDAGRPAPTLDEITNKDILPLCMRCQNADRCVASKSDRAAVESGNKRCPDWQKKNPN